MCGLTKWRKLTASLLVSGSFTGSARAAEVQVRVVCPDWQQETAAQVEARVRTSLLVAKVDVRRVLISCEAAHASVLVQGVTRTLLRPVVRRGAAIEDDVVATAESVLRELTAVPESNPPNLDASAEPIAAPSPMPEPTPTRATPEAKSKAADRYAVSPERRTRIAEVQAAWLGERWGSHWATGAKLGLSFGTDWYMYGIALGGRAALGEPASFDVSEWSAVAQLALTVPKAAGLRATAGAGVSLLVASPATNVASESTNLLSAACLQLDLSRPWRAGPFLLVPSLGARVFSARRSVRLNAQEQLVLPWLVPQAALMLGYRFR